MLRVFDLNDLRRDAGQGQTVLQQWRELDVHNGDL